MRQTLTPKALDGLRDAYLRLEYISCLNELTEDQAWIDRFLRIAKRKIGKALKEMEPDRRLPNVRQDTKLGRAITEAEEERRKQRKARPSRSRLQHVR